LLGQGATEYLVLLAVVLIIALVSVALLGFFPGMASDAQITQSQMYWQGAAPISILESAARYYTGDGGIYFYMRIRNSGNYPIRVTGIIGGDGGKATQIYGYGTCGIPAAWVNMSDYVYLSPGEETYYAMGSFYGLPCNKMLYLRTTATTTNTVGGASSVCQNSSASPGTVDYKSIGFEYIAYIDGQQITKQQIGKDFIVKCMAPY
jgi:hypothetical protein